MKLKNLLSETPTDTRFTHHKADASLLSAVKYKLNGINQSQLPDYVYQNELKINNDGDIVISFYKKPRFQPKGK